MNDKMSTDPETTVTSKPQSSIPSHAPRMDMVNRVAFKGGLEAGGYAFVGSTLVSLLANRLIPPYKSLTLQGKVFLVTVVTVGCGIIGAEHAVFHFNRPFLVLQGQQESEQRDKQMTLGDTLFKHRYEIAGGLLTAAVSGGLVHFAGNQNRTGAEKFMSLRLFAHAVGLGSLLGLVAMASVSSQRKKD